MTALRSLCVFCGSKDGADPLHRAATARLGGLMAEKGVRLVYGGGNIGLMGVLADAVLAGGGQVIGVIPDFLMKYEVGHTNLTELVVVDSMHERKRRMFEMADAFVALPGGIGTLDETIEIMTWKQLQLHAKPIVLVDGNGYWQPLLALFDQVVAGGFAHPKIHELVTVIEDVTAVFDAVAAAPPPDRVVLTSHL